MVDIGINVFVDRVKGAAEWEWSRRCISSE